MNILDFIVSDNLFNEDLNPCRQGYSPVEYKCVQIIISILGAKHRASDGDAENAGRGAGKACVFKSNPHKYLRLS